MAMIGNYTYPANIWEDQEGVFQIRFNDMPEISGSAASLEEALETAKQLLGDAVADRIQAGEALPEPIKSEES